MQNPSPVDSGVCRLSECNVMKESERIFCDEVARNCNAVPYPASIFAEEEASGRHGYVKKNDKTP